MSKDRRREHALFLDWLIAVLKDNNIDALIVSGDIFESGTPPNYALELYYNFLVQVFTTGCNQVIIVGGNHDSPATLHAPKQLLKHLHVNVTGSISEDAKDDIVVARDRDGKPSCIICCVPFLRDRDIRPSVPGESYEEKSKALLSGIKNYYDQIKNIAVKVRKDLSNNGNKIPIVGSGHLFAAGGQITDGVRDIYVGSLGQVHASYFPTEFDYVALGHLHKPQKVSGLEHIRYAGSPIPLSFGEAGLQKVVLAIEFDEQTNKLSIEEVVIPEFQELRCIRGDLQEILNPLESIGAPKNGDSVWVEVQVDSDDWEPDIINRINEVIDDQPVEVLAVKYLKGKESRQLIQTAEFQTLDRLTPQDVFEKRLSEETGISEEDTDELKLAYNEIVNLVLSGSGDDA